MDAFLRCDRVVTLTARLADGTMAADSRELVEMHLLTCPSCLQHVRKAQLVRSSLAALPGRHVPEHLAAPTPGGTPS
ncbi:zf-HC2 domain-containing protein [Micromonospora sp. WMMD1128]|uniref:anti-sigma factor family protein n=1 Tax=Micromonospora sp. WMMD1128 TaxID=3015150 RepID=UPI00248B32D6|nr:zf-HC2 domain-containing protein [Micromonospora sp. WMMD1128]WBB72718.1 zf-HC2 domain-containing protein [Micromonospora sp. WMMD1128]